MTNAHRRRTVHFVVFCALAIVLASPAAQQGRPIEIDDILAWKSIGTTIVSDNGRWVAYRVSPTEGDSEVVVRATDGDTERRFDVGEQPRGSGGPPPDGRAVETLEFSADSRWVAFTVHPARDEAKRLRKQRKPLETKVALVELATGADTRFDRTRDFAFSGDGSGWLAVHRAPPDAAAGPRSDASGDGARPRRQERPKGSDLILLELATGRQLLLGNVADFAFDDQGRHLVWTVASADTAANGVQLRDLATGTITVLDSGSGFYVRPTWNEAGTALTVLKGVEDKAFESPLYSVLGFTHLDQRPPRAVVYEPAQDGSFPAGMTVSPNRSAEWTPELDGILFGIHEAEPKPAAAGDADRRPAGDAGARAARPSPSDGERGDDDLPEDERPDLVLWHWQDPRLQSQQQVQADRDRRFSYLSVYWVGDKTFVRLADDEVRDVVTAPKGGRWAVGLDSREYDVMGSLDGRRHQDVYAVNLTTGERRLAQKRLRWFSGQSPDGRHFLYYEDGHYHAYALESGTSTNLTRTVPASFVDLEDDHNVVKPPVGAIGWAADGARVLLSDNRDIWSVPVGGGEALNLTGNGRKDGVRYRRRLRLDPEEKGIDLSAPIYVQTLGEATKQQGIARIDPGSTAARSLLSDDAAFARLLKAEDADTFVYSRETYNKAPELYAAGADLAGGRRLTDVGAAQAVFAWSAGSRLIDYTSAKGDKLQAALYLPAGYEPGKSYPTVVYIYERLTQDLNRYFTPTANGFNKSVYTSKGYAVLMPDIRYRVNDPGMSAVWCVVPALKAAVATGIVDERRVGLHGHSWGGYQTSHLVTQTNAFKAAVAGAPLTNMVSMYSLIYKNTGSTNQPIFESSQGRFAGGYWDHWDAYLRNSPVFFAKNVTTPLMILHNDKDGAVDFTQGVEYFNTLRRLRKPVIMLQYVGENHGLRKPANQQDYTVRMQEFFDHHLTGAAAPPWLTDGVMHRDMEDHLKERARERQSQQQKKKSTTEEGNRT